jgi:hypothetical protein
MACIGGDVPMTHVYYHPIAVTLVGGKPTTMRWRGITYRVLEVNEPWHLMDRWWEPLDSLDSPDIPEAPGGGMGG